MHARKDLFSDRHVQSLGHCPPKSPRFVCSLSWEEATKQTFDPNNGFLTPFPLESTTNGITFGPGYRVCFFLFFPFERGGWQLRHYS